MATGGVTGASFDEPAAGIARIDRERSLGLCVFTFPVHRYRIRVPLERPRVAQRRIRLT